MRESPTGVTPVVTQPQDNVIIYQKKVMIVMPWQKQVSPLTAFCVSQLIDRRRTATLLNYGDAFVAHSRNACADIFLSSSFDWMLTIDDDCILPFGNAEWYRAYTGFNFPDKFMGFNAIDRLMSHKKTLVGALYFGKHPKGPPVYNEGAANSKEADYARSGPHDEVKPTRWVGTGCMLIHRSVFEAIEKRFPRLARGLDKTGGNWFTSTEAGVVDHVQRLKNELSDGKLTADKAYKALEGLESIMAAVKAENTLGCGEDVSFCLRAAASGHVAHVDMGLICGHLGPCVYGPGNTSNKKN